MFPCKLNKTFLDVSILYVVVKPLVFQIQMDNDILLRYNTYMAPLKLLKQSITLTDTAYYGGLVLQNNAVTGILLESNSSRAKQHSSQLLLGLIVLVCSPEK